MEALAARLGVPLGVAVGVLFSDGDRVPPLMMMEGGGLDCARLAVAFSLSIKHSLIWLNPSVSCETQFIVPFFAHCHS